jgi:hypothetical protein
MRSSYSIYRILSANKPFISQDEWDTFYRVVESFGEDRLVFGKTVFVHAVLSDDEMIMMKLAYTAYRYDWIGEIENVT